MDDLIKALVEQLDLDEEIAQQAVETVLAFLKDKLPAGLGDQLENILDGADDGIVDQLSGLFGGDLDGDGKADGGIGGMLGGLLGKK
ncbi:MAG: hypothetical protein CL607_06525 [Anaerolineaceae bacterium]|nr:hypothetical protein [Anaerolineaceae bacterium]